MIRWLTSIMLAPSNMMLSDIHKCCVSENFQRHSDNLCEKCGDFHLITDICDTPVTSDRTIYLYICVFIAFYYHDICISFSLTSGVWTSVAKVKQSGLE